MDMAFPESHSYVQAVRKLPAYTLTEAAYYLRIPRSTLSYWALGGKYHQRKYKPLIELVDKKHPLLSFVNLVEAHVLCGLRRKHQVPLYVVRRGLDYLQKEFNSRHPLADHLIFVSGVDLFVKEYGRVVNITEEGQLAMKEVLERFLHRVEHSPDGVPIKLYPFLSRQQEEDESRPVEIDPAVAFGHPVIPGTACRSDILAERFQAGDSIEMLVEEYGLEKEQIEKAIQWEEAGKAA